MSDLIKREDAIKKIIGLDMQVYEGTACIGTRTYLTKEEIIYAIDELPSVEPEQKWIPVTEALPKNAEFVLLTIRRLDKSYNQTPFISVGYVSWNQNVWWCAHDGDCDSHNVEVLAWMPLPESYKGE